MFRAKSKNPSFYIYLKSPQEYQSEALELLHRITEKEDTNLKNTIAIKERIDAYDDIHYHIHVKNLHVHNLTVDKTKSSINKTNI